MARNCLGGGLLVALLTAGLPEAAGAQVVNDPLPQTQPQGGPIPSGPIETGPVQTGPVDNRPLGGPVPVTPVPQGSFPLPPAQASNQPMIANVPTGVVPEVERLYGRDLDFDPLGVLGIIGFEADARLRIEYNDNIRRLSDDRSAEDAGLVSRADWLFSPTLSLKAGRAIGRQQLFFVSSFGRDFYARNTELNRNNILLNGGVLGTLGARCNWRLQGGWQSRATRFDQFGVVLPSTTRTTNLNAGGGCRSAGGLGFNLGYDRGWFRNELESRRLANSDSQGVNGSISYALGERGDLSIQGFWRESELPNQTLPNGERNGTEIKGASGGVNYRIGPSLRAGVALGFTRADPRSPFSQSFSGATWNLSLDYSGPRLGASVGASRGVSGGNGGFATYQVGTNVRALVRYRTGQRISLSAGWSYDDSDNRGFEDVEETGRLDRSRTHRLQAGADYALNQLLQVGLDVNHQNRSADPDIYAYKSTGVVLTLRAGI